MDYERKITPHWIGQIVRRKLGLKTERQMGGYVLAHTEGPKLARLFEKYGIVSGDGKDLGDSMNSMNFNGETGSASGPQGPLII